MASSSALRSGIKNYARYLNVLSGTEPYTEPISNTYELLETALITSNTHSVTFSNLNTNYSSTYKHLQFRIAARLTGAVTEEEIYLRFNGSNSNNYRWHFIKGNGSTVTSSVGSDNASRVTLSTPGANAAANIFGAAVVDFLDVFSTNKYKTIRSFSGAAGSGIELMSGNWYNETSAITSILFGADSGDLSAGTRISLYGLRSA